MRIIDNFKIEEADNVTNYWIESKLIHIFLWISSNPKIIWIDYDKTTKNSLTEIPQMVGMCSIPIYNESSWAGAPGTHCEEETFLKEALSNIKFASQRMDVRKMKRLNINFP